MLSRDGQNNKNATSIRPQVLFVLLLFAATFNPYAMNFAEAGFTTNFQPDRGGGSWTSSDVGSCIYDGCGSNIGDNDPTPMAEAIVQIGGQLYYHVIVGDPATGFALESYSPAGNGCLSCSDQINPFAKKAPSDKKSNILLRIEAFKVLLTTVMDWGYKNNEYYKENWKEINGRLAELHDLIGDEWLNYRSGKNERESFRLSYFFDQNDVKYCLK